MDLGAMQRLVHVDVPKSGDHSLIQEQRLDRSTPSRRYVRQVRRAEGRGEWLGIEFRKDWNFGASLDKQRPPEASSVYEDECLPVRRLELQRM